MGKKTKVARTTNHSEEDIKIKIILPLLRKIGFSEDQLTFEDKFTIPLGHNQSDIKQSVDGYSDILCKSSDGKRNLFVIEVKRDDVKFTQKEIEQVISYAKLVHPIAPLSILTNGKDLLVYDTYTKELYENNIDFSDPTKLKIHYGLKEDTEYRYEALKYLVGYNLINLKALVEAQQKKRMSTFLGDFENLNKKYIPGLYKAPSNLDPIFKEFLSDTKSVFLIIGEQGVGKTNAMCYLAQKYLENQIAFFYAGHLISENVHDLIKDDCNWFFSPQLTKIEVVKRLAGLASSDRKLIIFIDAVDEVTIHDFSQQLNELVLNFKDFTNVKIVISSKTNTTGRFLEIGGESSDISHQLFESAGKQFGPDKKNEFSYKVELFSGSGFNGIYALYCNSLNIDGAPPASILTELHRGIALKVFCIVFQGKQVDHKIDFKELFELYLERILSKIKNPAHALRILHQLSKCIFEKNEEESHENYSLDFIEEEEFRNYLKFGINDEIPHELFDYNILTRQSNYHKTSSVGFYYTMVRDFLMVSKKLDIYSMNFDSFKAKIAELSQFGLGRDLISVIDLFSDATRKEWIHKIYTDKCEEYANKIEQIIDLLNPQLKNHLFPGFIEKIGFVFGEFSHPFYCGIRDRLKDEDLVCYFSGKYDFELWVGRYRLKHLEIGGLSMVAVNPIELAQKEMIESIKKIVKAGLLIETECKTIEVEVLFRLIQNNQDKLQLNLDQLSSISQNSHGNLNLNRDEILKKTKKYFTLKYFQNLSPQMLHWDFRRISIRWPYNNNILESGQSPLQDIIEGFQDEILNDCASRSSLNDEIEMKRIINILMRWDDPNYSPPLPHSFPNWNQNNQIVIGTKQDFRALLLDSILNSFSKTQIEEYIIIFFKSFIECYSGIIKTNFGSLSTSFQLFKTLPVDISFTVNYNNGAVRYLIRKNGSNSVNCVEKIEYEDGIIRISRSDIEDFFVSKNSFPLMYDYSEKVSNSAIIRNFVYQWIEDELKDYKFRFSIGIPDY